MLPAALATGVGTDVQRNLATVVVGGLVIATLLTLFILPTYYFALERWVEKRAGSGRSRKRRHSMQGSSRSLDHRARRACRISLPCVPFRRACCSRPDAPWGPIFIARPRRRSTATRASPCPPGRLRPSVTGRRGSSLRAGTWTSPANGGRSFIRRRSIDLIEQALKANPDLEAAQAALRGAWENVYAQRGAFFPSVDANFNPTRQKIAELLTSPLASDSNLYSLHTAQVSVAYTIDVFGGTRRQVESLKAQADSQRFQLEAAYLTLTSNVVAGAIEEAALARADRGGQADHRNPEPIPRSSRRQYALGQIAEADVVAQEAALAQTQATLPPLEKQLAQQRDLLARLAGRFPSETLAEKFDLSSLDLPAGAALEPSLEARGAAARCARGRGAVARGERRNRRRHCQPAAQHHALGRSGIGRHRSRPVVHARAPGSGPWRAT